MLICKKKECDIIMRKKRDVNAETKIKNKIHSFEKLIATLSKEILEDKTKCVQ